MGFFTFDIHNGSDTAVVVFKGRTVQPFFSHDTLFALCHTASLPLLSLFSVILCLF